MDILEQAKILGEALQTSDEFVAYDKANIEFTTNEQAQSLVKEYNDKSMEASNKLRSEDITAEEMIKIRKEISIEYTKLCENEVINNFLETKKTAETLLEKVNAIIHYYVTGEEATQEHECSGSCSSCGGCH